MTSSFPDNLLKGKTMFIAGGSSGINLGIAEQYGRLGANLIILSRSQDKIDKAVNLLESQGSNAIGIASDVRDYDGVEAAFKTAHSTYGNIDCVISGAAGNWNIQCFPRQL